ncbi:MAG TPA: sigma 54-interacting transcriptional regulator [Kofleriaceae bacterium]
MTEATGSTETAVGRHEKQTDRIELSVIGGPDAGKRISGTRSRCVIGSGDAVDLALTDPTVSRFHCEIVLEDGRAIVHDLGAKNRTLVEGVAVISAPLADGAVLTLGNTTVRFEREPEALRTPLSAREQFGGLVGRSRAIRDAFVLLEHAAASDTAVLLRGESGTGKDLAAASLHQESARREGPFVVVDVAGVPEAELAEELFGTNGAFVRAHGGTLYLVEIGDLELNVQRNLLRAIESSGTDVRLVASTHRDLRGDVNARAFRADLYFRLAVLEIVLPPLRERADDIPLIVQSIVSEIEEPHELVRDPVWIAALLKHPWPGNVRELRSHVERAARYGRPQAGSAEQTEQLMSLKDARARWIKMFESQYLAELLQAHGGNVTAAARTAGVDRVHFYRLLGRAGLK